MVQAQLTAEEIKKRALKVEEILSRYRGELTQYKRTQREILQRFAKELEKRKIEEIKKNIQS